MTGIKVAEFSNIINQNTSYQDNILNYVNGIISNNERIIKGVEGDYFNFLKDYSGLQEKGLRDISAVVMSYSDSLTSVKKGYIKQSEAIGGTLKF